VFSFLKEFFLLFVKKKTIYCFHLKYTTMNMSFSHKLALGCDNLKSIYNHSQTSNKRDTASDWDL